MVSDSDFRKLRVEDFVDSSKSGLVKHAFDRIRALILAKTTLGPDTADDIAQDVVFEVWQKRDSFEDREDGSLSGWLCKAALHRAVDEIRKRTVRADKADEVGRHFEPSLRSSPTMAVQENDVSVHVRRIIAAMPDEQRRVTEVWARQLRGNLTVEQAAKSLGLSKTDYANARARAKRSFSAIMEAMSLSISDLIPTRRLQFVGGEEGVE